VKLVTDQPGDRPLIWEWMNKRTQLPWSSDLRTIACMRDDGTVAAAVGFNAWQTNSCFMHVAFETGHSMTRDLLKAAFEYPFVECGKSAVYVLVGKENAQCLRLVKKLGYRQLLKTVDCVMFEMVRASCRWIKEKEYGKEISAAAA